MKRNCLLPECDRDHSCKGYCARHYARWRRHGDPRAGGHNVEHDPEVALWSKVDVGDCWEWTGATNSAGYGQIRVKRESHYVHRFTYELLVGPIPEGLELDHLCRNVVCVNPDHLEPVTTAENGRRGYAPGSKTRRTNRCIRGHFLVGDNLYINPRGDRQCRACKNMLQRERRRKRQAVSK